MYKLFGKLFIKDYLNTTDERVRAKAGTMAGVVGIISNILLGITKVVLGIITLSISIIADAINNITDSLSSVITIIGYKLSLKEADEDHPFGHQRIEFICALFVSIIMFVASILLLKESVEKMINPVEVVFDSVTLILLLLSVVIKILQGEFYNSVGKAINSIPLKANAKDALNDSLSTLLVLLGALITIIFKINLDAYIGAGLAVYVIISSISLIKEAMDPLIGTIPPKERIDEYKDLIKSYDGILGVHDVVCHTYGPTKLFMTAHAEVSSQGDVLKLHEILDNIEFDFRNKHNIDLTLHMDPIEDKDEYTNEIRFKIRDKIKAIDKRMDIHDFRLVKGESHTNLIFDVEVPLDIKYSKDEIRSLVTNIAKEIDPKFNLVLQIDQMYDRKH